jgi:hypothetical protein
MRKCWARSVIFGVGLGSVIGALGCGEEFPAWCAVDEDETVVVGHPAEWDAPPALELAWKIDGNAAGHELLLASNATVSEEANRLAIVDFQLGEVIVTTLDGGWVGRWGRRGAGPGEIGHAVAARWVPGPVLQVYDPPNSKFILFDSAGAILGERHVNPRFAAVLGGGVVWLTIGASGSLLAQPVADGPTDSHTVEMVVVRADSAGENVDTVARNSVPVVPVPGWLPIRAPGYAVPFAAEAPDGELAISGMQAEYLVTLQRPDGRRTHICRSVDPQPLNARERTPRESVSPDVLAALATAPRPNPPASVSRLSYDVAGRLWVQRDRPRLMDAADAAVGREGALYDVYRGATYLGEIQIPDRVRLLAATANLLIGLHRDSLDVNSVVAYRVK